MNIPISPIRYRGNRGIKENVMKKRMKGKLEEGIGKRNENYIDISRPIRSRRKSNKISSTRT